MRNLRGLGHLLIALRIARGLGQRSWRSGLEFTKLRFREMTQWYFGITLERAAKILDALGIEIHIKVDMPEQEKESEVEPEPVEA